MSLQLSWSAVVAFACCVAIMTGCAPFRPWSGNKAVPAGSKPAARTASNQNLEGMLEEDAPPARPASTKPAAKSSRTMFGGDNAKKEAARQTEIDGDLAMARLGERRGQSENAKQIYKKVTQKFPEHPAAFHRLGVIYAQEGNYTEAHRNFENALQIGTPSVDLLSDLGYCYYLQSRYEEAERVLRQAHRQKPNHESTCNNLGLVLGAQGRFAESLEMFQRVNSEAEAYSNLAYVFSLQGDLVNAKKGYVQALTLDNKLRQAAKAVIQVEERLKQHEHQRSVAEARQPKAPVVEEPEYEPEPVAEEPVAPPRKVVRRTAPAAAPRVAKSSRANKAQRNPLYSQRPAPQEEVEQPENEAEDDVVSLAPIVDAMPREVEAAPEALVESTPIESTPIETAPEEVQPIEPAPSALVQDDPAPVLQRPVVQRPVAAMPKASNNFRPSQREVPARELPAPRQPEGKAQEDEQPEVEQSIVVRPTIVPPMAPAATKSPSDAFPTKPAPAVVHSSPAKPVEPTKTLQPILTPARPKPAMDVVKSTPTAPPVVAEKKPNRASAFVPVESFTPAEPAKIAAQPAVTPVELERKPAPISKPAPSPKPVAAAPEAVAMPSTPRPMPMATEPALQSPRTLTTIETAPKSTPKLATIEAAPKATPKLTTIVEKPALAPAPMQPVAQAPQAMPTVVSTKPVLAERSNSDLASLGASISTKPVTQVPAPQVPTVQSNPYFAARQEPSKAAAPMTKTEEPATLPPIVNAAPRPATRLVPSQVEVAETPTNNNLPPIVSANDFAKRQPVKTAAVPVVAKNSVASAPASNSGLKGWVNTRTSANTGETLAPVVTPEQLQKAKMQR